MLKGNVILDPGKTQAEGAAQILKFVTLGFIACIFALVLSRPELAQFHALWKESTTGRIFWIAALAFSSISAVAMGWRIYLWRSYRSMPEVDSTRLPFVSVIIPAFNEGAFVRQSIFSAAHSDYPKDRLEIIVIDDGSTDDTWTHIQSAAHEVGDRANVSTLRLPANSGKRRALFLGFQRAAGDVFVTLDSDSALEPDALKRAVAPLVHDSTIGCVAGCVRVLNPGDSIITRFLKCYFSMSFKFVRAYQNQFRGVFCTPGALSVYRADVVRKVANEWLRQRFLGLPCTTGEDRSMTNLFLREGWSTAYQGNAVVWSKMPHTYSGLVNMFLRWARSNIRETIVLWRFLFTPFRAVHLSAFRFNMFVALLGLVVPPLLVFNSGWLFVASEGHLLRFLAGSMLYALLSAAIYYRNERDGDWIWLIAYTLFWPVGICWILPYAALTLRNNGWLTRGMNSPQLPQSLSAAPTSI